MAYCPWNPQLVGGGALVRPVYSSDALFAPCCISPHASQPAARA